jgi:hypothetical protein
MQIRNELLEESPYLSDSVMKTSVTKEDVLDNAMIRDVLVANPHSAKSDEIINMLENRTITMPDYMMEQILAGEDTVSAKEILEAKKAWWDGEAAKAYTRLINHFKGDSITPANEDSLNWLFTYRNDLASQYDKAGFFHSKGEYSQAEIILNSIPFTFNLTPPQSAIHNAYLDFYEISKHIQNDTVSAFRVDSVIASFLQIIVNSNTGIPAAFARNILIADVKMIYQEPIILPDTSLKQLKKNKYKGGNETVESSILNVFPNPANDYFIVKIQPGQFSGQGKLNLFDEKGILIRSYPVTLKQDQIIIPTSNFISGLYLLVLELDRKWISRIKLTIINNKR